MGHEGIRRYGANTAWLMSEKILRMFMGLFVGIWVARYLGPEQFGLLSYAQSFVFLFTAIATLGLDSIVVRELVKDSSQQNVLLGTAFTLKLIGSLCILPLLWLGVQFTSNDIYTNLLIFIIASGTIFQSFNVIDFYYQSSVLSKYVAFANTITLVISSIIKIVLILNQASLLAFAIVGVFDAIVLSLGLIYFYWQKTHHSLREWQFDRVVAKQLLADSWPLILSSTLGAVYMRIDQVMINSFIDSKAVGQYAAAMQLSNAWLFIPTTIASSVFPAIVKAKSISCFLYYKRLLQLYSLVIWISLLIIVPTFFLSDWVVLITFGENYKDTASVLNISVWSNLFISIGIAYSKYLTTENFIKHSFYRTLLGAIVNIALNVIMIPRFGIVGAAVATIMSQIFANYIYDLFNNDLRDQFVMKTKAVNPIYIFK